jgi:hypothetical protein
MDKQEEGVEQLLKLIHILNTKYNVHSEQIMLGVKKVEDCLEDFRNDVPKADEYYKYIVEKVKDMKLPN